MKRFLFLFLSLSILYAGIGNTTYLGENWYEVIFTDVGNHDFVVPQGVTSVKVLVVAGGGGAGYYNSISSSGGGGGAGGLILIDDLSIYNVSYGNNISVTVGDGGAGSIIGMYSGSNGGNSVFGTLIALGGGGGGSSTANDGVNGGSGGGGRLSNGGTGLQPSQSGLSGTYGFGYNGGGNGANIGSGGGAGGAGNMGVSDGGAGKLVWNVTYSTGGGAALTSGSDATANSGNGGPGTKPSRPGYKGGSGIVIVRYHIEPVNISIITPENITYNYFKILLNITNQTEYESIWYNWNGTNITYLEPLNITFTAGTHTLIAWVNNSDGLVNSENITFSVIAPTNLFENFTNLSYGTYYFNATVTNGTHNFSTETYTTILEEFTCGILNYPHDNLSRNLSINYTVNDIFYVNNTSNENLYYNITFYLNDTQIHNSYINESQDIVFLPEYVDETNYTLKVNYKNDLRDINFSYEYFTYFESGLLQFISPTTNGWVFGQNHIDVNVSVILNSTEIKNITVFLYDENLTLINSSTSNSSFFVNFTNLNYSVYYINATGYNIDDEKFVNTNDTIMINLVCASPVYNITYSSGIETLNFKLSTWKQYGVQPTNQTDDFGTFNVSCNDTCKVYLNFNSEVTGFNLKTGLNNSYYYSELISNSTNYTDIGELNTSGYVWLWGDFNRPTGTEYDINLGVCEVDE